MVGAPQTTCGWSFLLQAGAEASARFAGESRQSGNSDDQNRLRNLTCLDRMALEPVEPIGAETNEVDDQRQNEQEG
jgi:hypothetical protein